VVSMDSTHRHARGDWIIDLRLLWAIITTFELFGDAISVMLWKFRWFVIFRGRLPTTETLRLSKIRDLEELPH